MEDDPLASLDSYLLLVSALIVFCHVWTYHLLPPCMPDDVYKGGKPSFLRYMVGAGCMPFVRRFHNKPMTAADFPQSAGSENHNIEAFASRIQSMWTPESDSTLHWFLLRYAMPWWGFCHVLLGANRALDLLQPYIITCVIRYMEGNIEQVWHVPLKVAALQFLVRQAKSVTNVECEMLLAIRGFDQIWAGLELIVLRKMHKLSTEGIHTRGVSSTYAQQIINDCREMAAVLWMTPLRSVLADGLVGIFALKQLGDLYGWAVFVFGAISSVLLFMLSTFAIRKQFETGGGVWVANLTRQNTLNMMFERFRELRMYNWTLRCAQVLEDSRRAMMRETLRGMRWGVISGLFNTLINPWIVIVAFFITVFVNGERVNFERGLLSYTYMTMVTLSLMLFTACRGTYLDIYYRAQRIEGFLRLPECGQEIKSSSNKVFAKSYNAGHGERLSIEDATYTVRVGRPEDNSEHDFHVLTGVTLQPRDGELVLVTGAMGGGKTTLLLALLGEFRLLEGKAVLPEGPVAFQPQVPYLLDGTIKDNILFGIPAVECNEEHLQRALRASQLAAEMSNPKSTLSALREFTRVGKRGSQLSGGQRARVCLARTTYAALQGARLAMLDDPVASVDNEVLQAAWRDVVLGEMKSTTRVVAVNTQLLERLAPSADRLVVVSKGAIVYSGPPAKAPSETVSEALGGDFDLSRSLAEQTAEQVCTDVPVSNGVQEEEVEVQDGEDPALALVDLVQDCSGLRAFTHGEAEPKLALEDWRRLQVCLQRVEKHYRHAQPRAVAPKPLPLVSLSFFFRTWGLPVVTVVLSLFKNLATPIQYFTVKKWEDYDSAWGDKLFMIAITIQVSTFSFIDVALGNLDGFGNTLSSLSLRRDMDTKVMALGLPYFWQLRGIEEQFRKLVYADLDSLTGLFRLPMGILQVMLGAAVPAWNAPFLWVVLVFSAMAYWQVTRLSEWQNMKLAPARNDVIAKLDLEVADQFDSLVTLRAMKRTKHFDSLLHPAMMNQVYWNFLHRQCDLLVGTLNNFIGGVFLVFATYGLVRMKLEGVAPSIAFGTWQVTDGVAGMIAAAVNMYLPFQACTARYRELEAFLDTPFIDPTDGSEPPQGWPSEGRLSFERVTFRYAPHTPAAVQGVSFEVRAREKLGIVGKTGSGKSTLASLLLRLGPLKGIPPSSGGRVLVDGIDLASLNVDALRRVVAVVPQEPTSFPWSLKQNVGEEFTDAEVLAALSACGLDPRQLTGQEDLRGALYAGLSPGMTTGQLQLLMAARALVRRPRIMILDECTAAIDRESADRLLDVVMEHAREATVLSIAHRLRFVLKSDRILVLGHLGAVLGFDTPQRLLEDSTGYFAVNYRLEQAEDISEGEQAAATETTAEDTSSEEHAAATETSA